MLAKTESAMALVEELGEFMRITPCPLNDAGAVAVPTAAISRARGIEV